MTDNGLNGKLLWAVLLGTALMVVLLYYTIDAPSVFFFQQHKRGLIGDAFKIVTWFGRSELFLVPAGIVYLIWRRKRPGVARKAAFVFVCAAVSGIVVDVIKFLSGRARPSLLLNENAYGFDFFRFTSDWASFPSGHAATAMSMALAFSCLFPRYRVFFFLAACLVAFSRLVVVAHFPSDVVGGMAVGLLTTHILRSTLFRSWRERGELS